MEWNDVIIGQKANVKGNLKTVADVYLYGQMDGKLSSDKKISIQSSGVGRGEIECVEFENQGTLEGNITAKKVILTNTCKLLGNLTSGSLRIDEGAVFIGCSKKFDPEKNSKLNNFDPIYEI